ncbi:MAG: GNAT family N-acetyltransferase [Phycisphaerales bacterium]|nr:MAG: GNAT family N-acetyltransferase [Phycisphaerales bacterium]
MTFLCLDDREEIEQFLRRNVYLYIYCIGDLDDFFWPYTTWYGLNTGGYIDAVALLYEGKSPPTLVALSDECDVMKELVGSIRHLLPERFHAHLSPRVEAVLLDDYDLDPHGEHYKMALRDKTAISKYDCSGVVSLSRADLDDIETFYEQSYPGNWFDGRMLETGQYFGVRKDTALISVAGVHVHSAKYKVAALGNIATLPSYRGKGYAKRVTAKLCKSLSRQVSHIGLNVKSDNIPALSCYEKLGFEKVATYAEFNVQRK